MSSQSKAGYRVKILHYLHPHLIWVEVLSEPKQLNVDVEFEQLGIYGVLPVEVDIDVVQGCTSLKYSDKWTDSSTKIMDEVLSKAVEVWFLPSLVLKNDSVIFNDNIHKYGEIVIIKHNGVRCRLSDILIKHNIARPHEAFPKLAKSDKLKTKLNRVELQNCIETLLNKITNKPEMVLNHDTRIKKEALCRATSVKRGIALRCQDMSAFLNSYSPTIDRGEESFNDGRISQIELVNLLHLKTAQLELSGKMEIREPDFYIGSGASRKSRGSSSEKTTNSTGTICSRAAKALKAFENITKTNLVKESVITKQNVFTVCPLTKEKVEMFNKNAKLEEHSNQKTKGIEHHKKVEDAVDIDDTQHIESHAVEEERYMNNIIDGVDGNEKEPYVKRKLKKKTKKVPQDDENRLLIASGPAGMGINIMKILSRKPESLLEERQNMRPTSLQLPEDLDRHILDQSPDRLNLTEIWQREVQNIDIANKYVGPDIENLSIVDPEYDVKYEEPIDGIKTRAMRQPTMSQQMVKSIQTRNTSRTYIDEDRGVEYYGVSAETILDELDTPKIEKMFGKQSKTKVNPLAAFEDAPSDFIQTVLHPMVMVHSKMFNSMTCWSQLSEAPFPSSIHARLQQMNVQNPMRIQKIVWPSIMRGRNTVVCSPPGAGKTMSYIPPICSMICDAETYAELPKSHGPLCLILSPYASLACEIANKFQFLLQDTSHKVLVAHSGTEHNIVTHLINGCSVLVATPPSLIRLVENYDKAVNLRRLAFFVADDFEFILKKFEKNYLKILKNINTMKKNRVNKEIGVQTIICSRRWNDRRGLGLDRAQDSCFCISAYLECVIYSHTKLRLAILPNYSKIQYLKDFLMNSDSKKRKIVVCGDLEEVSDIVRSLEDEKYPVLRAESPGLTPLHRVWEAWKEYSRDAIVAPVLVCTDQCLQLVNIRDAHHLIHFSLPESFSNFCNRFATMLDSYKSILDDSTVTNECQTLIMLGEDNNPQLPKVLSFVQRCGTSIPNDLWRVVDSVMDEKELSKARRQIPFCPSFIYKVHCRDQLNCRLRHRIFRTEDAPPSWIPREGWISFYILHMETPVLYSVRVLDHLDASCRLVARIPQTLNIIQMKMNHYYQSDDNRIPHGVPKVGDLCAVEVSLSKFQRCRVINVIRKRMVKNVVVHYLDRETIEVVETSSLLVLPEEFKTTSSNVARLHLVGVQPVDKDTHYTDDANIFLRNVLQKNEKMLGRAKIVTVAGTTIFVENIELYEKLEHSKVDVAQYRLADLLVDAHHARFKPDHANHVRTRLSLEHPRNADLCQHPIKFLVQSPTLPMDKFCNVRLIMYINCNIFAVRLISWEKPFLAMEEEIQKYVNIFLKNPCEQNTFAEGQTVLAPLKELNCYARAYIAEINSDNNALFFYDYGHFEYDVPINSLIPNENQQFTQFPAQALCCGLYGVRALSGEYGERMSEYYRNKLSFTESYAVKVYECDDSRHRVALCRQNMDSYALVNQEFVDEGMGEAIQKEMEVMVKDVEAICFPIREGRPSSPCYIQQCQCRGINYTDVRDLKKVSQDMPEQHTLTPQFETVTPKSGCKERVNVLDTLTKTNGLVSDASSTRSAQKELGCNTTDVRTPSYSRSRLSGLSSLQSVITPFQRSLSTSDNCLSLENRSQSEDIERDQSESPPLCEDASSETDEMKIEHYVEQINYLNSRLKVLESPKSIDREKSVNKIDDSKLSNDSSKYEELSSYILPESENASQNIEHNNDVGDSEMSQLRVLESPIDREKSVKDDNDSEMSNYSFDYEEIDSRILPENENVSQNMEKIDNLNSKLEKINVSEMSNYSSEYEEIGSNILSETENVSQEIVDCEKSHSSISCIIPDSNLMKEHRIETLNTSTPNDFNKIVSKGDLVKKISVSEDYIDDIDWEPDGNNSQSDIIYPTGVECTIPNPQVETTPAILGGEFDSEESDSSYDVFLDKEKLFEMLGLTHKNMATIKEYSPKSLPSTDPTKEICKTEYLKHSNSPSLSEFAIPSDECDSETTPQLCDYKLSDVKTPKVSWRQTKQEISIKIELIGVQSYEIDFDARLLRFRSVVRGDAYELSLHLYGSINKDKCSHEAKGLHVSVKLWKLLPRPWLHLTSSQAVAKNPMIVYEHKEGSDDEEIDKCLIKDLQKTFEQHVKKIHHDNDLTDEESDEDFNNDDY